MSAGHRSPKGRKPLRTPMIKKPPGMAIQAFLTPFIQAMGDTYKEAVALLIWRGQVSEVRAREAIHTAVVEFLKRWMASAQVPAPQSWPAFLTHEASHVLSRTLRKDARLLTYGWFEPDGSSPGLPHPPSPELSPEAQAVQNEEVKATLLAARRLPPEQYWALTLWSNGVSFKLIGTLLGVSEGYARVLKCLGLQALRKMRGFRDPA